MERFIYVFLQKNPQLPLNLFLSIKEFYHNLSISTVVQCVLPGFPNYIVSFFSQNASEIDIPSHISTTQSIEKVEWSKIIQLGKHFFLGFTPISWCPFDIIQYRKSIIQNITSLTTFIHSLLSFAV